MNKNTKITARVSCVQKNLFTLLPCQNNKVKEPVTEITAKLKGKFYNLGLENPVVGDYVTVIINEYNDALIDEVLPRTTVFKRPNRSGYAEGYVKNLIQEVLVANFDYVFIVTSLNQNFNENRIARYVSITLQTGAKPVVVLSKADLCDNLQETVEITQAICDKATVLAVSSFTGYGLDKLQPYLQKDKTIALLGSSGVGKSTLLNTLNGQELMKVNSIRYDDDKGKHTTTYRQMFQLQNGAWIMDTPGLREIGIMEMDEGLDQTFSDITNLFSQCKFNDCSHKTEPGCAVLGALQDGSLKWERWQMYEKLTEENNWGKEKRKQIAKHIKQLKKDRYSDWNL